MGRFLSSAKRGKRRTQLKREREVPGQEDGEVRPKRRNSGDGRPRGVFSEDDAYTTDDLSEEDEHTGAATAAKDPHPSRKQSTPPRRWEPFEDKRLTLAVNEAGEKDWKSIASKVGTRNHVQCLQRWKKVLRPGLVKGQWDAKEDAALMKLATAPFKNWGVLSQSMSGRTSKQCRERWCHHLDPSINKGAYTQEEDNIIIETQAKLGNRWSQIAARLPGRTENSIKIRCKALQRKVTSSAPSSGSGSGGGRSLPGSSPRRRPARKSTGSSTTPRPSRESSSSSSTTSASCFSESGRGPMAEQPAPVAPLGVPPTISCPPQQFPSMNDRFSRGLKVESHDVRFPPVAAPCCGGSNTVFMGQAPAALASGHDLPGAAATSEQDGWRFGSRNFTNPFQLPPPGGLKLEGGFGPHSPRQQQQQPLPQQCIPQPGQFVDIIPARHSFPSGLNGGGGSRMLDSSLSSTGGLLRQPQRHLQQPSFRYEYDPSGFAQVQAREHRQGQAYPDQGPPQEVELSFDSELMSQALAAVVAATDDSADTGDSDANGTLPEEIGDMRVIGGDGRHPSDTGVDGSDDLKAIGEAEEGGDGDGSGVDGDVGSGNGPIKECCSFLDLASAASADDNIVGDVKSW